MKEAGNAQTKKGDGCLGILAIGGIVLLVCGFLFYREYAWLIHFEDKDIEVTEDAVKSEGITPGASYPIPVGFYVAKGPQGLYLDQPLAGQPSPRFDHPSSRSQFEASRERWPHVERILEPGAVFRVDRVFRHISFEYSNIYVVGTVTDGTHSCQNVHWAWPKLGKP